MLNGIWTVPGGVEFADSVRDLDEDLFSMFEHTGLVRPVI